MHSLLYTNEIILVFKGTALASTITIMDIMGYARQLYGTEYDALTIYGIAGGIYLIITGIATLLLRQLEIKCCHSNVLIPQKHKVRSKIETNRAVSKIARFFI